MRLRALFALFGILICSPGADASSYRLFESGPVRPVALSPNGEKLFVANTPDGYLEIFDVEPVSGLLVAQQSVPVGLEPVAVAARSDSEVWVVNHLSDSVSIVDVASSPPRVVRTLIVGDEPRDIVFAGSPQRAFITTAHRGQHREHPSLSGIPGTGDPQLTTEGIGRADVWVFEAGDPGAALGGLPVEVLTFFADTPRALATDGDTVYVAGFHTGNRTTTINQLAVAAVGRAGFSTGCSGSGEATGLPGPGTNADDDPAPSSGVIVKRVGSDWVDSQGCTWNSPSLVNFSLPDRDVFAVDADTLAAGTIFTGVGTILFNMAINPVTGQLYVTNTESPNLVDFEGPGDFGGSTVQGRLSESRVSVLDPGTGTVTPRHLNSHIDYSQLHTDAGANHTAIDAQIPHSLATPLQIVVSDDLAEQKVYIAAFGSSKVGVFDASDLEAGAFDPTVESANYIPTGGGPAGLALTDDHHRLYVLTRFDQAVSVFDVEAGAKTLLQTVRLPTPEPASVIEGRPFLYDAVLTSGNGEASCASCHIFGDLDSLGWNLGNPDDVVTTNNVPQLNLDTPPDFHPMKGPMTTQTLRGLSTHGGLHWRADRVNGFFGLDPCTGSSSSNAPCDEAFSFDNFIVAFEGLVGKHGTISTTEMQKFTDFALQLMLPPNPVANLDGSLTASQSAGDLVYRNEPSDANPTGGGQVPCIGCHFLDPSLGFFGAGGEQTFEGEPQRFKVSHLRNMVQKVGMFGLIGVTPFLGDQVRGFGYLHDGSVPTLKNFVAGMAFDLTSAEEDQLVDFMLAFPTDLAPVVGQQVTLGPGSVGSCVLPGCADPGLPGTTATEVAERIDLLETRASTVYDSFALGGGTFQECDLVVKTVEGGAATSYAWLQSGSYLPDDGGAAISAAALRAKGETQDLHYLCAPPGASTRVGLDRDEDYANNGVDNCPGWPNGPALGTCTAGETALLGTTCNADAECGAGGFCSQAQEDSDGDLVGDACEPMLLPEANRGLLLMLGALGLFVLPRRGRS